MNISINISQLVKNNLSITVDDTAPAKKVNWCNLIILTVMYTCVNNCYWITLYNVTRLEGNKFTNGLILGISELLSGVFAGIFIKYTSAAFAF